MTRGGAGTLTNLVTTVSEAGHQPVALTTKGAISDETAAIFVGGSPGKKPVCDCSNYEKLDEALFLRVNKFANVSAVFGRVLSRK